MGFAPPKLQVADPNGNIYGTDPYGSGLYGGGTVDTYRNLVGYTVQEDVTPLDISDSTGGVGATTVTMPEGADAMYLHRRQVTLIDSTKGTTTGILANPSSDGHTLTLPAQSRLSALSVTRVAQPFSGTLTAAFTYYLNLVGVTSGVNIDTSLSSINVVLPGWQDVVWTRVRNLCSAYQVEIALVSNNVVIRPIRQRTAKNQRDASVAWTLSDSKIAQTIEFFHYQNSPISNSLIYPLGGWTSSTQIINVDAGAIQELDVLLHPNSGDEGLGASLSSVIQPVCVSSVGMYDNNASVYAVTDQSGVIVDPVAWVSGGGDVHVTIGADTQSLHIVVTGALGIPNGPFNIAMPYGDNKNYSSLRILGSGVSYNKVKTTFSTGLSADLAPQALAATVDTPALSDWGHAFSSALWTLHAAQGANQSITVRSRAINRVSDNGSYAYPLVSDWESHFASMTINAVDTQHAGMTLNQVEAEEYAWVSNTFANQAFGNTAGARVKHDRCWYRIQTATLTESEVNYTADWDTTLADWEDHFTELTVDQIDAKAGELTLNNLAATPLL